MKIIILPCLMLVHTLIFKNPATAQNGNTNFATINAQSVPVPVSSATVTQFYGSIKNDRVLLNWTIDKNQASDKFEVERSTDGKNFVTAALVFGTDKPGTEEYQFYEKNKKVKTFYRLKIIQKDNSIDYSVTISPVIDTP